VLFLLLTLFFYGDYLNARSAYKIVQKEWARLSPLMGQLKALENKIEIEMRGEKDFLEINQQIIIGVNNENPSLQALQFNTYNYDKSM